MANLRVNNLTGTGGRNAIDGSILLQSDPKSLISVANTTGLDFGTDQFTIEFWIYLLKEAPVNKNIFARSTSNSGTTGMIMWFDSNGHLEFDSAHGATGAVHTGAAIKTHTWHHIAVTRDGSNNTRLYLNGVNKASASSDTTNIVGATNLQIASNIGGSGYFNDAYISNFRMVKGTAVYSGTSIFTPPTEKLTAIDGTILLCCQDSDDPTQEATGKTITALGGSLPSGDTNIIRNGTFDGTTSWYGDSGAGVSASGNVATVTNGGGDYLYAIAQANVCRIGGKYRIRGTIVPTMSTSTYQFRVRAGGSAVSWKIESGLTSGSSYDFDTGEVIADGTTLEIGSGNLANNSLTQFTLQNVVVTAIDPPKQINEFPSVGVDEGVTFGGDTKVNSQQYMYFSTGDTSQRSRGRGIVGGGWKSPGAAKDTMQYINIASEGIGIDFGSLTVARMALCPMSSTTRGLFAGGYAPTVYDTIDYVTIASTGDAIDFGNMTATTKMAAGASNSTRGLMAGGDNINTIQYITMASVGNATDFGDLLTASKYGMGAASSTRAIWFLGSYPSNVNTIEYTTIATTGNSVDFGDRSYTSSFGGAACASSTRAVSAGGYKAPGVEQSICYVEIATTGNATDFGDLQYAIGQGGSGMSNGSRGVFGGYWGPTTAGVGGQGETNICEYITFTHLGNAKEWGDLYEQTYYSTGVSDSHGGLS